MPGKYLFGPLPYPSLTIINFSSKDACEYICHVQNDIKDVSSNSVHLTCIECLKIYISTASQYVANGSDHIINCNISGTPTASSLSCSKFNNSEEEEVIEKYSGGTLDNPALVVIGFTVGDEGKYLCRVENIAGITESNTVQLNCVDGNMSSPSLTYSEVRSEHEGMYICCAANEAGLVSSNEIMVHYKRK
ncbi:unnamed protein product [Mytilus coruscus]|uniref:Ig-like domain-containing protein n=1 Tax=Mytilus coruscus TaxID=42192 RepID=A0A6J8CY06_MYTCO|nr:unnamed protein product [Mytilus coruscus]